MYAHTIPISIKNIYGTKVKVAYRHNIVTGLS